MKILGHPIHLMLIHFPSALFPLDLVFSFIAKFYGPEKLSFVSAYILMAGALAGWAAILTGLFDLSKINESKPSSMKKALLHGGINTVVLIVFTLFAWSAFKKLPGAIPDAIPVLTAKFILVCAMIAANFMGGDLIIKNKVLDEKV